MAVAFSPDGSHLATESGREQIWPLLPLDLVGHACARLRRNLTTEEWSRYLGDEIYRKTCPEIC